MAQREGTLIVALTATRPGPSLHRRYLRTIKQKVLRSVLKVVNVGDIKIDPRLNQRLHVGKVPRVLKVHWSLKKIESKGKSWQEAMVRDC